MADNRDQQKEAIRERADIVEVVAQYVALKPSGSRFKGLCPFHSEQTASFLVDPERGLWRCYGACGTGGDVFSFVQKIENLTFPEAAEKLARRYGLPFQRGGESSERTVERERLYRANALAERFFREEYRAARHIQAYVEGRGLLSETVEQFRLGFAPPDWERLARFLARERVTPADAVRAGLLIQTEHGLRDRFRNRLIIPILDLEGRPIAFGGRAMEDVPPKYLNSPETPIFTKGKTLFGLHLARKSLHAAGCAVLVEGYMDVIACHQAGFHHVVASLGTAITGDVIRLLRRYTSQLVLAYDGDSAGLGATLRSAPLFEEAGCEVRIARLPAGADPDSVIKEQGAAAFGRLLDQAEPLIEYHLTALARRHDLSTPEGRLALVREAAQVVGQLKSAVAREHHRGQFEARLRKLAEQWHPGDAARAIEAERALRQELQQAWSSPARMTAPARPDEFDPPGATAEPAPPVTGETRAEALLLRAALTEERWARQIAAALGPDDFEYPGYRRVAAALFGDTENGTERLQNLRADPELTEIISGLLVIEIGPPLADPSVSGALERLIIRNKRRMLKELERVVLPLIAQGLIGRDDERYQEYLQLRRDLGGQGLKGEG